MEGRSSVFVDLSSLNVLFKHKDSFVFALNFSSGLERLSELMQVLGNGYDIYLCAKPRMPGEGDLEIPELSISGATFIANKEEISRVLSFFRESAGVNEVYLCNWLACYIESSRVPSFESVVYYGSRVAHITVTDRMLNSIKLYEDQAEFENAQETEYSGYGDVDLIDTDGIIAKYPEFRSIPKTQITVLAPLIHCYKTTIKMPTAELFERLKGNAEEVSAVVSAPEPEPEEKSAPAPIIDANTIPADDKWLRPPEEHKSPESYEDTYEGPHVKPRAPGIAKLMFCLSCLGALACGTFAGIIFMTPANIVSDTYYADADNRIATLQTMASVYNSALENLESTKSAFDYVNASGLAVTVVGFDSRVTEYEVRCACASQDIANSFKEYIEKTYVVSAMNSLGVSAGEQGGETYVYSIVFFK